MGVICFYLQQSKASGNPVMVTAPLLQPYNNPGFIHCVLFL